MIQQRFIRTGDFLIFLNQQSAVAAPPMRGSNLTEEAIEGTLRTGHDSGDSDKASADNTQCPRWEQYMPEPLRSESQMRCSQTPRCHTRRAHKSRCT